MDFEYYMTSQANGLLTVEDIGNCAIDLFNDRGWEKVLIVDTNLGATRLFTYGPFSPDLDRLPPVVECTLKQFPYSQAGIGKEIRTFLRDYMFQGTQAYIIDKEEALDKCRDLIEYMRQPIY